MNDTCRKPEAQILVECCACPVGLDRSHTTEPARRAKAQHEEQR